MEELKVIVTQQPAQISINFEEIKAELDAQMEVYRTLEVNEDVLTERKKDVATLRKISKAIDDKRKEVKKTYMIPYDEFEKKAKELIDIVQQPINLIDTQVKAYEEKKKAEKMDKLLTYFNSKAPEGLAWDKIVQPNWSNLTFSYRDGVDAINDIVDRFEREMESIKAAGSEVEEAAIKIYLSNYKLVDALDYMNRYEAQKRIALENERKREEEKRIAEERRLREEQERIAREERERIAAEERAKVLAELKAEQEKKQAEQVPVSEEVPFPSVEEDDVAVAFPGAEDDFSTKNYKVSGTEMEHGQIEMYLNSIGVDWRFE